MDARRKHRSRHVPPQVICYYGGAGIGKTTQVFDWANEKGFKDEDVFIHCGNKWFDGYCGQPIMLLDEIDKSIENIGFHKLLQLCDKFPTSVEGKGCTMKFNSPIIFLCASTAPEEWVWKSGGVGNTKQQLERRITECYTRYAYGEPWKQVTMWSPTAVTAEMPLEEMVEAMGSQNYFV